MIMIGWSVVISVFALVISVITVLISIMFTTQQTNLFKEHNRKTVKPILSIEKNLYDYELALKLTNNGIGPAIIKSILIVLNQKEFEFTNMNVVTEFNNHIKKNHHRHINISYQVLFPGSSIKEGTTRILIYLKVEQLRNETERIFYTQKFKNMTCKVFYESIYEEPFEENYVDNI